MSGGTNNFTPRRRNWQVGQDHGPYAPNNSDWNHIQASFPRFGSVSFHANPDANRGANYPWQSSEERGIAEPFSLAAFPALSHPPMQIPILGNLLVRDFRPNHRQTMQRSPSGLTNQQNIRGTQGDDSRLTGGEQSTALRKLKKEIYNPTLKNLTRGLCLYYRDQAKNVYNEMQRQKKNDVMRCAVCLEDFEPKETVMVTPCNHMFHEDCIVPWVKNHPHCPVCRFSLGEKRQESASDNNTGVANAPRDDLLAIELISVIRAMEDAFLWESAVH